MRILVINSGSSSINFQLHDMEKGQLRAAGRIESIGETKSSGRYRIFSDSNDVQNHTTESTIKDHTQGLQDIFRFLDKQAQLRTLDVIAHRIVHGGESFQAPVIINDEVIEAIRATLPLAPLHNAANLTGIETARHVCPNIPQVAVFDTAFFQSLPSYASRYALPEALYRHHHVRRYGFHGISHQSVTHQAVDYLKQPLDTLRLISLHLGNGASVAAIRDGQCIDTSMGMTPLEGLIMGTRCGDLDPSIVLYLVSTLGMKPEEVESMLNNDSGMKGLCGVSDMRDVHRLIKDGDKRAQLALDMYCYRIVKYIGAYYLTLDGLDALIFTGGVGENDPVVRESVCNKLSAIGIRLNPPRNRAVISHQCCLISDQTSPKVMVIPSNEELEIARQAASTVKQL